MPMKRELCEPCAASATTHQNGTAVPDPCTPRNLAFGATGLHVGSAFLASINGKVRSMTTYKLHDLGERGQIG
jgi:hypothetical protein